MTPDGIEPQDHETDQRLAPPPLVPYLLPEPNHPVGPLHVIVGPHPLAHRVVQIGHDLGKLLRAQLLHRLDQLGHGSEGRILHDRGPAATRLVVVLGCIEEPIDPIGEVPQGRQLGQRLQHPLQVAALALGDVLPTLHDPDNYAGTQSAPSP